MTIFNWGLTREPYRAVYGQGDTSPDHPLWRLPNVLVSPHVAGDSARSLARAYALAGDQIRLFAAGERLVNEVPPMCGLRPRCRSAARGGTFVGPAGVARWAP